VLSALGEEGWELVSITPNSIAYLKREIEGGEPTQSQTEKAGEVVSGVKPKYRNPVTCGVHDVIWERACTNASRLGQEH
jgi:hypothetical protein